MSNIKVVAFTLGDPVDPTSRSGVNHAVFSRMGMLCELDTFDCSLRGFRRILSAIKSFSFNYQDWRRRSHQNNHAFRYRSVLCNTILEKINTYDAVYQDGAMFFPDKNDKLFVINLDANVLLTSSGGKFSVGSHYAHDNKLLTESIHQEKKVYDRADHIFVRSQWVKQSLQKDFKIKENKITINPSGVHLDGVKNYNKNYKGKNILFVGNGSLLKGFDILLKAFGKIQQELKNVNLHIVGKIDPKFYKLCNDNNIKTYGYLGKDEKASLINLYKNADLFILPSRYDAFPKVLMEAGAFKVPCIATDVCGISDIISHGKNGFLVKPDETDSIVKYALQLLNDSKLSKEMGCVGYLNYLDHFNWDKHVDLIMSYIKKNV